MESPSLNLIDCGESCAKKLKRKCFELMDNCNESFLKQLQGGNEDIDGDYKLFLGYLTDCVSGPRQPVGICNENAEEEEDVDPDYRMVWDKLTVCGKSYALEVHEGGGMLVLVKYEGLDDSDEYWDWPARRKLSKGRKDGEEMPGAKDLRNVQSKDNVECLRCLQVKKRKGSLLEEMLRRECLNPESFDAKGCRKLRRVDMEDNQISEPHGLLTRLGSRQVCRKSWNTKEGVKIAVTNQKSSVENNKKVDYQRILRSSGEKEKRNSVPEMELSSERGSGPHTLRTSRNEPEEEETGVTTPSRNVETNKNVENRRILRSSGEIKERKSIAEKELRPEPGSDPGTLRRSWNDTELEKVEVIDLTNVQNSRQADNRRILRSDLGKEKKTAGEMKLRCESQFSPQASRKLRNVIERGKIEVTDHFRSVESNRKLDDRRSLRSDRGKERRNLVAEKELRSGPIDPVSHGSKGSSRPKLVVEDNDITRSQHNCDTEDIEIDGCYQFFLNGIEKEGDCVVFVHGGERVRYEDDDIDCDSDSEILMWDHDPYLSQGNNNPYVPAKVNASIDEEDSKKEISLFRRKVMSILKRPYDAKEYEDLLREVKARKCMKVHRELRRPKSVSVDRSSKSYLDHHQDLKRKIDAVQHNRPTVLNILRGFFLWLENVPNEGQIFKPWLDALCLEVLPPSK